MSTQVQVSPFKSNCLESKIALVTGGGSGICFEITRQLLLHGCSGAVICGRRADFLVKAARMLQQETGKQVFHHVLDVRDSQTCVDAVAFTLQKFGKLDILVNGAAGNFLSEVSQLSPKGFKTVMEIDAQGTFNMCHASFPALRNTGGGGGGGVVINISATLQYGATWYQAHASAAKSAVDSLTRSMALEWGPDRIRVVGIAPGPIADTPGTTKLAPGMDVTDMVAEGIPLGRMGTTWDIGMAAVYVCCEAGSYVTGDILVVDGGQWLYKPPMVPRDMVAELSRQVEAKSRAQEPRSKL